MMEFFDNKTCAIVPLNEPSPVGFINLYEEGDIWQKIKGCEDCPAGQRIACCRLCPLVSKSGCFLHLDNKGQNKPFHCVVAPRPDKHRPNCVLEYKCIKGTLEGKVHRTRDPKDVFI